MELVGELDRRGGWAEWGQGSFAGWLAWRCGLAPRAARELQGDAYLSVCWEPDGSLAVHGRLAPEDGALLLRALEALRDTRRNEGRGSAEPRPARQASNAEALAQAGESRPGGERYQVVVHADETVRSDDGRAAAGSPATHPSSETAEARGRSRR